MTNELLGDFKSLYDADSSDEEDGELTREKEEKFLLQFFDRSRARRERLQTLLNDMPFLEYSGSHWCAQADLGQERTALGAYPWILDKTSSRFRAWLLLNSWEGEPILNATDMNCLASFVLPELLVT
jgi:hypothetical protein